MERSRTCSTKIQRKRTLLHSLSVSLAARADRSLLVRVEKVAKKHQESTQDLIIQYTYPRIDTEVSRKLNHLLKAPFCVHPGTGAFSFALPP